MADQSPAFKWKLAKAKAEGEAKKLRLSMGSRAFRIGFEEALAGIALDPDKFPPRATKLHDPNYRYWNGMSAAEQENIKARLGWDYSNQWNYESGRQFALIAPELKLKITGRWRSELNPVAFELFKAAVTEGTII